MFFETIAKNSLTTSGYDYAKEMGGGGIPVNLIAIPLSLHKYNYFAILFTQDLK